MSNRKRLREEEPKKTRTTNENNNISSSQSKRLRVEDALAYLDKVKTTFAAQPHVYDQFLSIMKDFKAQLINTPGVIERVSDLFFGHADLIYGFNTFLPPGYKIVASDIDKEKEEPENPEMDKAILFFSSLRKKLSEADPEVLSNACNVIRDFENGSHLGTLCEKMFTILSGYPNLWSQFQQLLPTDSGWRNCAMVKEEETKKVVKVGGRGRPGILKRKEVNHPSVPTVSTTQHSPITKEQPIQNTTKQPIQQHPQQPTTTTTATTTQQQHLKRRHSKWGPSYRCIAHKTNTVSRSSSRTQLCNSVLNDEFVSVPVGTEDSRSNYKKSQYDEILFQCEDDRSQLDWVIDQNISTIQALESTLDELEKCHTIDEQRKCYKELKPSHTAAISRIYGDKSNEVIEGCRRNPLVTLQVVLLRLKQKDQEWQAARRDLNRFWKDVYERGAQKFWENNISQFKVNDRKALSNSALLAEVEEETVTLYFGFPEPPTIHQLPQDSWIWPNELKSVNNKNPDVINTSSSGCICGYRNNDHRGVASACTAAGLAIAAVTCIDIYHNTCPSKDVHIDILKLLKISSKWNNISPQSATPYDSFWTTFVLPFFGHGNPCEPSSHGWLLNKKEEDYNNGFGPVKERLDIENERYRTKVLCANKDLYCFMRLYQIMYERISRAKQLSMGCGKPSVRELQNICDGNPNLSRPSSSFSCYKSYLSSLRALLAGRIDQNLYEERVRFLFGVSAFPLCSMELLFSNLAKQTALCCVDQQCRDILRMYLLESRKNERLEDGTYFSQTIDLFPADSTYYLTVFTMEKGSEGVLEVSAHPTAAIRQASSYKRETLAANILSTSTSKFTLSLKCRSMWDYRGGGRVKYTTKRWSKHRLRNPPNVEQFYVDATQTRRCSISSSVKTLGHNKHQSTEEQESALPLS